MIREKNNEKPARYGMAIDLDRCSGCGSCMVACAVENNVPPATQGANERTGITLLRVYRMEHQGKAAFVPMMCQQCGKEAPCASVCPQNAVEVDPATGIVGQIPQRCLGCRYCMAACPFHARYFNWWDPQWPGEMTKTLNPTVAPRMRGAVEKCNFCHGRWHAAREMAASKGESGPVSYTPACAEACPTQAIQFGDLNDPSSVVAQAAKGSQSFRMLENLDTEPKIFYRSEREWVRASAAPVQKENHRG